MLLRYIWSLRVTHIDIYIYTHVTPIDIYTYVYAYNVLYEVHVGMSYKPLVRHFD